MKKEDYKRLNDFLNELFLYASAEESKMIDCFAEACTLSDMAIKKTNKKYETDSEIQQLTYEDIISLSREIIEYINPDYLPLFDEILPSGILDFGYEDEYNDSCCHLYYDYGKITNEIDIKRCFNYHEVSTLIHEFIHYTTLRKKPNHNLKFLSEFLAIYFETIALKYMVENKGLTYDEVVGSRRIINFLHYNKDFNHYCLVFLAFLNLEHINENTRSEFGKYYGVDDKAFEDECKGILRKLDNKGEEEAINDYVMDIKYVVGTSLAYYAVKNCDMKKMVKLNDIINKDEYEYLSIDELLEMVDIEVSSQTMEEAIDYMNELYENKSYSNVSKLK